MERAEVTEPRAVPAAPRPHGPAGERHPSPKEYVRIALILGVVTAAEVTVYYTHSVRKFLVPLLISFAIIKFSLVALWFMHLKFDSRTYARFFVMGIALATTLYIVVLLTFRVFAK